MTKRKTRQTLPRTTGRRKTGTSAHPTMRDLIDEAARQYACSRSFILHVAVETLFGVHITGTDLARMFRNRRRKA